jgi:predicted site-specific integrase-resolvase
MESPLGLVPFARGCELLQVNIHTARRWLRTGKSFPRPSVRIGRAAYYRSEAELTAWLDAQSEGSAHKGRRTRAAS